MFDNLRDSSYYDDEQSDQYTEPDVPSQPQPTPAVKQRRRRRSARFMGMTAQQRFMLAFMFFIAVCVMGLLAMFVTGRMGLF